MKRPLTSLAVATLALLLATPVWADGLRIKTPRQLKVMTRNLYVGANLFQILGVSPEGIPAAAAQVLTDVEATNFPERAQALALEVRRTRPDLIGLQEVSLIRTQIPGDFLAGNPLPNAEDELADYLEIFLDALAALGLRYEVAATSTNADIEVPFVAGLGDTGPVIGDVRLTDRDVILKRRWVKTRNAFSHRFADQLVLDIGGLPREFTRSFVSVDARVRGRKVHFANVHLEVGGPTTADIQAAQAAEFIERLAAKRGPSAINSATRHRRVSGPRITPGSLAAS